MIDHELLVTSVTSATAEVFSMMLDREVEYTGLISDLRPSESGLISLVGITGDRQLLLPTRLRYPALFADVGP